MSSPSGLTGGHLNPMESFFIDWFNKRSSLIPFQVSRLLAAAINLQEHLGAE
jgi:hypothetical protein